MISKNITDLIGKALKTGDSIRVSTLRMLSSEFNYEKIALQHDLSEEEELKVISKEAKKRKEAIEAYKKAGEIKRAEQEEEELLILKEFLPPEVSEEEIVKMVDQTIKNLDAKSMADMGKVIGAVKAMNSMVDGAKVAEIVKSRLS